jgi:hypothetical protein
MVGTGNLLESTLGRRFFDSLPKTPGVYFMFGSAERLLYVGKAKSLRARLRSYARLRPGKAEARLLELVSHVRAIRWEDHATESKALARESELLRVLRPPYNIQGTDEELYLYLGIRDAGRLLELRLSNWPDFEDEGYEIFGGYRSRRKVKSGYASLLRLVHAYQCSHPRFYSYPARISREDPPWCYRMAFPEELRAPLRLFLMGRSRKLLSFIFEGLLNNDNIPPFMRPSLQEDIEAVKALFKSGPKVTRELKKKHGLRGGLFQPEQMNEMIAKEVRASAYCLKDQERVETLS